MRRAITVALAFAAFSSAVQAQIAADGDTIKVNGTTFRLWGIDAPEARQACADGWLAGADATAKLREMLVGRTINCEPRTRDRYGRTVAVCRADGQDLGAAMVRDGMAYAFKRYSLDYVEQESAAIAARAGVHAHDCEKPWEWRAKNRKQSSAGG